MHEQVFKTEPDAQPNKAINSSLEIPGGYKLSVMELFNWGTFDKNIWQLNAEGFGALITGENGSGKSTLVDALLTLLVANNQRNYNLSSGGAKRERSELSYVKGAYGKQQNEHGMARVKYCRETQDTFSVLLAEFFNAKTKDIITIAQFFWFEKDELKKFYITSSSKLKIAKNFSGFSSPQELKKRLRMTPNTQVFDHFTDYQAQFMGTFGLRSVKAMDLFNQIVAIKEIGKLSEFVRKHMLEPYA